MIPFINQFIRQWLPQSVNQVSKCQNLPWNVRSLWLTQSVNIARLFFVKKNAIPICVKFCVIIFLWNINPDDAHFPYIIVLLMNIFYYTSDLTFCSQTFQSLRWALWGPKSTFFLLLRHVSHVVALPATAVILLHERRDGGKSEFIKWQT